MNERIERISYTQKTWRCSPLPSKITSRFCLVFYKNIRLVFHLRISHTIMSLVIITLLIVLQNTIAQNCVAYDTPEKCFQMSATFANQVQRGGGRLRPGNVCVVCNKKRQGMEREAKKQCQSCADIFGLSFWSECESYTIGESLDRRERIPSPCLIPRFRVDGTSCVI